MKFLEDYIEIILAFVLFGIIVCMKIDFYHFVTLMLELMVVIELVQMLFVFFKKQRIKIRYMVDASIIFFIREILIALTTHKTTKMILFYCSIVGVFFFFRYLSLVVTYKNEA
jgi:uncharacterized membrane protein (DUF373 family)